MPVDAKQNETGNKPLEAHIQSYIASHPEAKSNDLHTLHTAILEIMPDAKLWFLDGRNIEGKVVSNPNIGYGSQFLKYADGKSKEFYQIGISANTSGISVYVLGLDDKEYLRNTYGHEIGKASVSGYCIKFKTLKDINLDVLKNVVKDAADRK